MNENPAPSVQLLKRLDINEKSYFICPKTHAVFSLPPDKADVFDALLKKDPVGAYDKVKGIIASKVKQTNISGHSPVIGGGSCLTLILTENCNLACTYCLEHGGKSIKTMPLNIALKSVDFLINYTETHGIKRITFEFFGGEPLLNWKTIQQVVSYAEARVKDTDTQLSFSITTNGTLLKKEMIAFLAEHHCGVTISIDGIPQAHDPYRRTLNGKPSHQLVVSSIETMLEYIHPNMITALMTLHHENLVYLQESVDFVLSLGIYKVGINPIRASELPDDSPLILTSDDYKQLAVFLKKKYLEYPELEKNPYSFTIRHRFLNRVNLTEQYHFGCGAGRNDFAVGIDGQLYPCSRFAFGKMMALGNVSTGIQNEDYVEACGTVDDSPTCCSCWVRYFCGGGCYYEALSRQKDLRQPFRRDCLNKKTMIETALRAKIEFAEKHTAQNKK